MLARVYGDADRGAMSLAANGGVSASGSVAAPLFQTVAGEALKATLGGAVGVRHRTPEMDQVIAFGNRVGGPWVGRLPTPVLFTSGPAGRRLSCSGP